MHEKNGSWVSDVDAAFVEGLADELTGRTSLFGEPITLIAGVICKRDLQRVIQHKLGVTDRQARAAVSSYVAEGWTLLQPGTRPSINGLVSNVSSAAARVLVQADARHDASVVNGQLGGRPRTGAR